MLDEKYYFKVQFQTSIAYVIQLTSVFSVNQSPLPSQSYGSKLMMIPTSTMIPQIHLMSQMNQRHIRTPLKSPTRTWTPSQTLNPPSPGRGKVYDLLT